MRKLIALIFLLTLCSFDGFSQEKSTTQENSAQQNIENRKGKLFASWGYNRSSYSNSNIRFWGNGYDFTITNAYAQDRQTEFSAKVYFNPVLLTIPQYNLRMGYFLTDKLSLTISVDHMKYVLDNTQTARVDGTISKEASEKWEGEYHEDLAISPDFLSYEHTDGLNIIFLELDYNSLFYKTKNQKFAIDLVTGVGIGATIPKTNAYLFDKFGDDAFHLSGGSAAVNLGLKLYFFKRIFLHPALKTGYVIMPEVVTNKSGGDKASQNFQFFQANMTLGYQF